MRFRSTLGNKAWMSANRDALRALFPATWTLNTNVNWLAFRFNLKLLGVDYRTEEEVGQIVVFLTKVGIVIGDGQNIRRCT